jgi:nitric oxide dioxygenase
MTKVDIVLVQQSWRTIRVIDPVMLGDVFYTKLFLDNPYLRRLFPVEMELQYQKLVAMLSSIISHLDKMETISTDVMELAVRHAGYGVKPSHYSKVGEALIWTIEKAMGKDFNPAVKKAWTNCYQHLSTLMQQQPVV